jgi:alkylation response protein AidB-like acyl-CoA dehydrogenase
MDAPGVSRGMPLDKVGQRALPQGEIYFDNVRLSREHLLYGPEDYEASTYTILAEANMIMGALFVGQARAAYELAVLYANERKAGGTLLRNHQYTKHRIFKMFSQVECARAMTYRAYNYNFNSEVPAIQLSVCAKVAGTQAAYEVSSEAIQLHGGNGLTREYPTQIGQAQRVRDDHQRETRAIELGHGQADAVDREAVANRQLGREIGSNT